MSLISSLATVFMNIGSMLGFYEKIKDNEVFKGNYSFLLPILKVIDEAMIPILICVIAAGTIYAVVLGINLAKAESSDKREEAKKRLINAIVGFGVIIVLLVVMYVLAANIDKIVSIADDAVTNQGDNAGGFFRSLLG